MDGWIDGWHRRKRGGNESIDGTTKVIVPRDRGRKQESVCRKENETRVKLIMLVNCQKD